MVFITAESYKNAGVYVIKDSENYIWVKMKGVQDGLGLKNIRDRLRTTMQGIFDSKELTEEQVKQYIKTENELNKNLKNNLYKYVRNDIAEKVIKNCRSIKGNNRLDKEVQRDHVRELLGFKENEIFESKEYSIVKKIKKVFIRQNIIDQYRVDKYFIDLHFPEHKLRIEIDENCHLDRSDIKEEKREATIKRFGITLIRINPDKEAFDIFIKIGEIQDFIYEFALKLGEKLKGNKMIEDLERSLKITKLI